MANMGSALFVGIHRRVRAQGSSFRAWGFWV